MKKTGANYHKMTGRGLFNHVVELKDDMEKKIKSPITVIQCEYQGVPIYVVTGFESREDAVKAAQYAAQCAKAARKTHMSDDIKSIEELEEKIKKRRKQPMETLTKKKIKKLSERILDCYGGSLCDEKFYKRRVVKTRKEHRCLGCRNFFPPGMFAIHESGLIPDEQEFFSVYLCENCITEAIDEIEKD